MTNVKCVRCGVVNALTNEICKACGIELTSAAPPFTYPEPPRYLDGPRTWSPSLTSIKPDVEVGDVLGTTIKLFSKNLWPITKIVLVIVTPFEIFKALSLGEIAGDRSLAIGTYALQIICNILIAPALIYAMMKVLQTGVAPGVNESYRWGLSKLGKVSAAGLIAWILQGIGLALCIVPGIFLGLAFELVYPMAVLENGSAIEILNRSYNLTKGHRWNILGASIVLGLLVVAASIPGSLIAMWLTWNGVSAWPVMALTAIVADIISQASTILSLVIYLSIMRTLDSQHSVIE